MNNKVVLRVLLVLTYVFAGLSAISFLMVGLMLPAMREVYYANPELFPTELTTAITTYLDMPRTYFVVAALLYVLEVVGAVLMWRLRPSGFHCYTLARLLLLLVPLLFLGKGYVGLGNVMMALLFIVVYWLLLKQLGAFDRTQQSPTQTDATTDENNNIDNNNEQYNNAQDNE